MLLFSSTCPRRGVHARARPAPCRRAQAQLPRAARLLTRTARMSSRGAGRRRARRACHHDLLASGQRDGLLGGDHVGAGGAASVRPFLVPIGGFAPPRHCACRLARVPQCRGALAPHGRTRHDEAGRVHRAAACGGRGPAGGCAPLSRQPGASPRQLRSAGPVATRSRHRLPVGRTARWPASSTGRITGSVVAVGGVSRLCPPHAQRRVPRRCRRSPRRRGGDQHGSDVQREPVVALPPAADRRLHDPRPRDPSVPPQP